MRNEIDDVVSTHASGANPLAPETGAHAPRGRRATVPRAAGRTRASSSRARGDHCSRVRRRASRDSTTPAGRPAVASPRGTLTNVRKLYVGRPGQLLAASYS